jgi:hypothetical protein
MPTALFMFVYQVKNNRLVPAKKDTTEFPNPEELVRFGFIPTRTRRNITFKASFEFKKEQFPARYVHSIQAYLSKELARTRITSVGRIWKNAFPSSVDSVVRNSYIEQLAKRVPEAIQSYYTIMAEIGGIVGVDETPIPVVAHATAHANTNMNVGIAAANAEIPESTAKELVDEGEGAFVSSQNQKDADDLADLLGGLVVRQVGGSKTRRAKSSVKRYAKKRATTRRS